MHWFLKVFIFVVDFTSLICDSVSDELNQHEADSRFAGQHSKSINYFPRETDFLDNADLLSESVGNQKGPGGLVGDNNSPNYRKPSINLLKNMRDAFSAFSSVIIPEAGFGRIAQSKSFVDKSLFIKHFVTRTKHSVVLAPKWFGKSTILSMLTDFFEMHIDGNGNLQDNRTSINFKIFQRLKIYQEEPRFFNQHFGNYTVLSVNFNDLKMTSLSTFLPSFRRMINRMFSAHPYLMRSPRLFASEKAKFENYSYPRSRMDLDDLSSGGRCLTRLLYKHYRKKCILLIDGIDAPAINVMLNEDTTDVAITFNILAKFIAKLVRNNHSVYRSLLVGTLKVGNIYTREACNLFYLPVFEDKEMSKYFGFTDVEVRDLLVKNMKHDKVFEVRSMFGGYRVENSDETLYNTHSIAKFIETGKFGPHLTVAPGVTLLKVVFEYGLFGELIEKSLETELPVTLRLHFKRENLCTFRPLLFGRILKDTDEVYKHEYILLQYLLENGYYTVTHRISDNAVRIAVPNIEMKNELKRLIYTKKFFTDKFHIKEAPLVDYLISIEKLSKNQTRFEEMCAAVEKIFEHKMPEKDFEFQGPLFSYPALCPEAFKEVYSEEHPQESERADIFIRKNDGTCIIIELKVNKKSAYDALKQIVSKKYYADKIKITGKKVFIGLSINKQRKCKISYLWNSDDISGAKNVTSEEIQSECNQVEKKTVESVHSTEKPLRNPQKPSSSADNVTVKPVTKMA